LSRDADPEGREARCSQGKGCIFWKGTQARLGGGVPKKQKPAVRRAQLPRRSGARDKRGGRWRPSRVAPSRLRRVGNGVTRTVPIVILMCGAVGPERDEMDVEEETQRQTKAQ